MAGLARPMGVMPVKLPERLYTPLWLVVIRGFGVEPILLLTNLAPGKEREHAVWIADVYLTRWKCEEAYRFVKQAYRLGRTCGSAVTWLCGMCMRW